MRGGFLNQARSMISECFDQAVSHSIDMSSDLVDIILYLDSFAKSFIPQFQNGDIDGSDHCRN